MAAKPLANKETVHFVLGTGCLIGYALLSSMSSFSYGDFRTAFESITYLAATSDVGCLAACAAILLADEVERRNRPSRTAPVVVAGGVGLCLATFLRAGCLTPTGNVPGLLAGDACVGACFALLCWQWWRAFATLREPDLMRRLAQALLLGLALFTVIALLPSTMAVPLMAVVLPVGSCALLLATARDGIGASSPDAPARTQDGPRPDRSLLRLMFATVSISALLTGLLLNIVPIALNTEDAVSSLTVPSALAAATLAVFAVFLLELARREAVSLAGLYIAGFVVLAAGYLTFPFLPTGGLSLSALAVGQFIVFVFLALLLARFLRNSGGAWKTTRVFAFGAGAACAGELMADAIATAIVLSRPTSTTSSRRAPSSPSSRSPS